MAQEEEEENVASFLLARFRGKEELVRQCAERLASEGVSLVSDLKAVSYSDLRDLKVPLLFARRLQDEGLLSDSSSVLPHKCLQSPCHVRGVQPVAFSNAVSNLPLPFRGRDSLVRKLADKIDAFVEVFSRGSIITRDKVLFIALEGLAGVGKTRLLFEMRDGVGNALSGKSALADAHRAGATASVYITFNGVAVGGSAPHPSHPAFESLCKERGSFISGQEFMRVSVVSQILYGKPWGQLPLELQGEIREWDDEACVSKLSKHVRQGLGLAEDRMIFIFLLVDESQQLGRDMSRAGCNGDEFLRGMFSWIVMIMAGESTGRKWNVGFVTLLAGTVLSVGGRYGVTDWLKHSVTVPPLDLTSALEVLDSSLHLRLHFSQDLRRQLEVLLLDCCCYPRLIQYVHDAWKAVERLDLKGSDFFAHVRACVMQQLEPVVERVMRENRQDVRRMVKLCLTGMAMPIPAAGEMRREDEACFKGYVYAEEVRDDSVVYKSPMLLVYALALKLGIPERVAVLRPQPAVAGVLEDGFLDILHSRLSLLEGQTLSLGDILPGAIGKAVDTRVVVSPPGDQVVEEKYQFYNARDKKFYHQDDSRMEGADGVHVYRHPTEKEHAGAGVVFKCKTGTAFADGRLFLIGDKGQVLELWFQMKGQEDRVSLKKAMEWATAALSAPRVGGRRRVYVLCSRRGFSFDQVCKFNEDDVLLVDLMTFMPEFLRRCQLN